VKPTPIAKKWPGQPAKGRLADVTTLSHIDALLGTTWSWDAEIDDDRANADESRSEIDAMLDDLVFDQG